jgi:S-adenosylmethionine-diacylglycerol 3-amino-3-carboxypropyl transferase
VRDNPLQFAVVREDPLLDAEVLQRHGCRRALLIASGGCTALALAGLVPDLELTLLDPNPAQLAHVGRKLEVLLGSDEGERLRRFNVEDDDPEGLSECGNFEALFRGLRAFLHDFVWPRDAWRRAFLEPAAARALPEQVFAHPHWPVAFELFFSDALLHSLFGPAATQHAPPGSYPAYFRRLFERGLTRADAGSNPFLHHVFLGHYLGAAEALPQFLRRPPRAPRLSFHQGALDADVDLGGFGFVGLSNVMDWMAPEEADRLLGQVRDQLQPGSVVMWRQLNNTRDLQRLLEGRFTFDEGRQRRLHARDRSLFYSSIHVGAC